MTLRAGAKTIRSLDGGFTAWARAGADVFATRLALGAGPVWL
jgi:3-mercaptopyruvate sulfurtransferase SseA